MLKIKKRTDEDQSRCNNCHKTLNDSSYKLCEICDYRICTKCSMQKHRY